MTRIAIHQPNFVPWFPYWEKMASADEFVVLGNAQYSKNGFINRFNSNGEWYTMPVERQVGKPSINDACYQDVEAGFEDIVAKLEDRGYMSGLTGEVIKGFIQAGREVRRFKSVGRVNLNIIGYFRRLFGLDDTLLIDDQPMEERGTDRLVKICTQAGVENPTYLYGSSAHEYMSYDAFKQASVQLEPFEGENKRSTIEMIQEYGIDGCKEILGRRKKDGLSSKL